MKNKFIFTKFIRENFNSYETILLLSIIDNYVYEYKYLNFSNVNPTRKRLFTDLYLRTAFMCDIKEIIKLYKYDSSFKKVYKKLEELNNEK